jgi:hypothetical protein
MKNRAAPASRIHTGPSSGAERWSKIALAEHRNRHKYTRRSARFQAPMLEGCMPPAGAVIIRLIKSCVFPAVFPADLLVRS